jgi:hypothetical protein
MKHRSPLAEIAHAAVQALATHRRRLGIVLVPPGYLVGEDLRAFGQFRLSDVLVELLSHLTDQAEKPLKPLGVFDADDLAEWIQSESYSLGSDPILVFELEPLLSTFGRPGTIGFFHLAAQLDPRRRVILVTHFQDLVTAAGFPQDRTWRIVEEGKWRA